MPKTAKNPENHVLDTLDDHQHVHDSVHLPLSGFIYTSTSRTEGGVRIPKVQQHKQSFALTRPIVKGPHPGHTLLNTTQK